MESWIKFITVLWVLIALHLSPSWSVPVPTNSESDERGQRDPFQTKGGEEGYFFEGDIRLRPGEDPYNIFKKSFKTKRTIEDTIMEVELASGDAEPEFSPGDHIWPSGIVPFMFPSLLPSDYRMMYEEAIRIWEDVTCIEFQHRNESDEDYLLLAHSENLGCSSFVGKKGGEQMVTMSSKCLSIGHAIHELGHAIGMWHEHSRPDRDTFIQVIDENIIETRQNNFGILDDKQFAKVPDVGYDLESIMHYGEYAFTKNGEKTIKLRPDAPIEDCDNRLPMGQRVSLSYKDKKRANKLYQCTSHLSTLQEPLCNDPQPNPSSTVPATTAMPTPTTTQPPVTPSVASATRLKSGNVLTFQFESGDDQESGMRCTPSPGCIPTPCTRIFGANTCTNIEHQFAIYNPTSKKIKSGNIVVLKSLYKPTTWLDCSGERGRCTLSQCVDNSADTSNSSYISECDYHQFKILGVARAEGKLLKSNHAIQLKHPIEDTYLNCSGKRCKLGEPQTFTLNKLRE